jgi:glycosyltransferase involved in cell wall biosynthesis
MISVCITTHDYPEAVTHIRQLLISVIAQDYEGMEIVVSDDSLNDYIRNSCSDLLGAGIPFQWLHNSQPGKSSINMNNALSHAKGDIIKPMFGDDYFFEPDTLTKMIAGLGEVHWGFATSVHNTERGDHVPYPHTGERELALGCNTYGCPSAMIFRKTEERFDEQLIWLMDCEFYVRMYRRYGSPALLTDVQVGIREWEGQQSNTAASGNRRLVENAIVGEMYPA